MQEITYLEVNSQVLAWQSYCCTVDWSVYRWQGLAGWELLQWSYIGKYRATVCICAVFHHTVAHEPAELHYAALHKVNLVVHVIIIGIAIISFQCLTVNVFDGLIRLPYCMLGSWYCCVRDTPSISESFYKYSTRHLNPLFNTQRKCVENIRTSLLFHLSYIIFHCVLRIGA